MSPVQNVWRQLVERRLWPVAIVLVAGLAAVPLMLAEDPEPVPPPPAPAAAPAGDELAAQPIVAMASAEEAANRRKVLGKPKNPFGVAKPEAPEAPEKASASVAKATPAKQEPTSESTSAQSGGGTSGGGSGAAAPAPAPTTPAEPAPKPRVHAAGDLTVRFGAEDARRQSLEKGEALPSAETPVLIYTGLADRGKSAVFLVADGVVPVGDAECRPSPEVCEKIRLRVGETEFLDVTDESGAVGGEFQLDLLKIHKGTGGASAAKAKASRKPVARTALLRSSVGRTAARLP